MANQYTLIVKQNNPTLPLQDICVFQNDPDLGVDDVLSLAWFTKPVYPGTTVNFQWEIEYDFVWSQTGELQPGVVFTASQVVPADLTGANKVVFSNIGGAYDFSQPMPGPSAGHIFIFEDGSIPNNNASVGIAMSKQGTFAVQSQPNTVLNFTPHPRYYLTIGSFQQGEVLDISQIVNVGEVVFPPNVYSMTAILDEGNNWTILPTSQVNERFLETKKDGIKWGSGDVYVTIYYSGVTPLQYRQGTTASWENLKKGVGAMSVSTATQFYYNGDIYKYTKGEWVSTSGYSVNITGTTLKFNNQNDSKNVVQYDR